MKSLACALCVCLLGPSSAAATQAADNLALRATASASEDFGPELVARFANDGTTATRWSAISGHNEGIWFELDWPAPVSMQQVVIQQYDTYVKELDVEVWDAARGEWRTLQHFGTPDGKLPLVVVATFAPVASARLRIANITNGPSFTEVEVYAEPAPPVTAIASDANGHVIGMVCDAWGRAPIAGAKLELAGQSSSGAWRASATSDEHGLFSVALPLGLRGELELSGTADGQALRSRYPAEGLQYGLTPVDFGAQLTRVDGPWRFTIDPPAGFEQPGFDDRGWSDIQVPGHWEMQGFRAWKGVGGYRRRFDAPPGSGRLLLRFDGVYSGAEVWLNGARVALHEGGALPFEVDVSERVHAAANLLALRVSEHTPTSDLLDHMSQYADFPLGGILRKVTLFRVPDVHVGALALATTFDPDQRDATLTGTVSILAQSKVELKDATLHVRVSELPPLPDRAEVASASVRFDAGAWQRAEVPISIPVRSPRPWNAEQPNLYLLTLELEQRGQRLQTLTQRIGFRQTEIRGAQILIDGRPVKVRGTCHHDSDPLLGRAVTPELERLDLELIKEANLNAIRTSHYPPLPELLDFADELGVYVEDEGSFCWTGATDDLRLTPRVMQLECELVARDRNHPSVFLWSLCNESRMGYGLWRSRDWVRKADPSRPTTGTYHADGEMDVAVRHNPITERELDELEKNVHVPVIWDESWCIWQDIWGDCTELWIDPGLRDYYVTHLAELYAHFMRSPIVQGTQIWAWSDDCFLLPNAGLEYGRGDTPARYAYEQYTLAGRGLSGDAQWGVVDAWRRKKPEFWHVKKLHSPVKIAEAPLAVTTGNELAIAVENQYDFRDLSALVIRWQLGADQGTAKASVAAHEHGMIRIRLARTPRAGEILALDFVDPRGVAVDGYRLPIGSASEHAPSFPQIARAPLESYRTSQLNGDTTYIVGQGFELGFGASFGSLRRGVASGRSLLLAAPLLHLAPTGDPEHARPALDTWRLTAFDVHEQGEDYVVSLKGEYADFQGGYDYTITPGGELVAHASFVYGGKEIWVRELGLRFEVPREADLLRWDRQAEYSLYPEDHIGRAQGSARAFSAHELALPPKWSWSSDNTPLGCNDFRSTKRFIHWGWIGYPEHGPGVRIQSDASQSLRARVDGERIAVFVNDLYDGTGSRYEWTANYGQGRLIHTGEHIEAAARLRLTPAE